MCTYCCVVLSVCYQTFYLVGPLKMRLCIHLICRLSGRSLPPSPSQAVGPSETPCSLDMQLHCSICTALTIVTRQCSTVFSCSSRLVNAAATIDESVHLQQQTSLWSPKCSSSMISESTLAVAETDCKSASLVQMYQWTRQCCTFTDATIG